MTSTTSRNSSSEFEFVNDSEYVVAAEELYRIDTQIKELNKQKEIHRKKLKNRLPVNKEALRVGRFKFKRSSRKGAVDYASILKEFEIEAELDLYRKPNVEIYSIEKVD